MNIWKSKSCEGCIYRKETECFRFPHSPNFGAWEARAKVRKTNPKGDNIFSSACAEYREDIGRTNENL